MGPKPVPTFKVAHCIRVPNRDKTHGIAHPFDEAGISRDSGIWGRFVYVKLAPVLTLLWLRVTLDSQVFLCERRPSRPSLAAEDVPSRGDFVRLSCRNHIYSSFSGQFFGEQFGALYLNRVPAIAIRPQTRPTLNFR